MQPLSAEQLRGSWGTVLLPINDDDTIDYGRLADDVARLIEAGVSGIYTNGTAGEFSSQTEDEFDRISAVVAELCERANVPFQLGVCHSSPQIARERLRRAVQLRPSAVQVILPDWVVPTMDEARAFLEGMAEVAGAVSIVLYHPPHVKRLLDPAGLGKLCAGIPNVIGLKLGDGRASWYAAMRKHLAGLAVFVPGHHLATGFARGAAGSYSNVACLSPAGAQRWWEQMQTDLPAALQTEQRILAFFQDHIMPFAAQGYSNPALDKLLAAIGGWGSAGTRLRWPYRGIPQAEAERLAPIARSYIPELF
jgi:4-hydroxy-tetrahydrodipicolinate synthase